MDAGQLALSIPIVAIVCGAAIKISRMRYAGSQAGDDVPARLEALENQVATLRQELNEAAERLDFTERLLAKNAEHRSLGPS